MSKAKRLIGVAVCLLTAARLCDGHIYTLPDFLAGVLTGMNIGFLILFLLPDAALEKLGRWKRHGS